MRLHLGSQLVLILALAALPATAQVVYDNGPVNGTTDGWNIANGFVVSDSFTISAGGASINGLSFGVWVFPGDVVEGVQLAITSSEFGGTTYFDQVISLTQTGCAANQFGYNVCTLSGSFGTNVDLPAGNYWLNLLNAVVPDDPVYWDENSGPSSASENSVGTIPSESFTLYGNSSSGTGGSTPEPGSILLFGSGVLGLAGVLRRRLR